ncbi:PIR protein [Plasmodium yoelii]|uniref:PIR protein n=2 Tax=Plasmodium yoelii TaxID=5861 RepID=A0AAF0B7M4_PLAYO|nr:PIR protein [Plasmodium yoelii]WBY59625.1 PIR protein [Plasmodium yoelii yoelii]VTZ80366.1 PIR protein [Plasmodium yoelii]|eukprot:XP_022811109.1 PIR protein [Plasmodium yoelii]
MNKQVCEKFDNLWYKFPDKLTSDNKYDFKKENFLDSYCFKDQCSSDFGKINAGFYYLLNQFCGVSGLFKSCETSNINVVEYIMIWLCYMLNLKSTEDDNITNLNSFYKINIENHEKYNSFIKLINKKKELMKISKDKVSKLYNLFKILCEMYTKVDEDNKNCNNYLKDDNKFFVEYQKLLNDSDTGNGNSSYNQLLSTLSTDYDKLKNECKQILSSQPKETEQIIVQSSVDTSSSSSIGNKLISVLSIFGAIGFLLGISYKYSLFGFRKRFKKQQIKEKIKNIKKKMNQ